MKNLLHFKLPEIVLAFLLVGSGIALSTSSGGFIIDFNTVGFSVMSAMQKGVYTVFLP